MALMRNLKARDDTNQTPLHLASQAGHLKEASAKEQQSKFLLDKLDGRHGQKLVSSELVC